MRQWITTLAGHAKVKVTDKGWKALRTALAATDPEAEPGAGGEERVRVRPDLRDHENVPMTDSVEAYFKREVLPYVPDAWVDEKATVVGYEVPFTEDSHKPAPMRGLNEIAEAVAAGDRERGRALARVLGG